MKRITLCIMVFILSVCHNLPVSEAGDVLGDVPSALSHLELKGTLFTASLNPLAIIEDKRSGKVIMYETGDAVDNEMELISITRGEVILKTLKGEFKLCFAQGSMPYAQSGDEAGSKWYNITREADTFIVDEQTVNNAISRVIDIMRNVKLKPAFINGEKSGVMVDKIAPIGILKEIGISKNDIIRSVNKHTLNSPYQIFTAYRKSRNEKELKVDIVRDGKPLELIYKVKS